MPPKPRSNHVPFPNGHFVSTFSVLESQHTTIFNKISTFQTRCNCIQRTRCTNHQRLPKNMHNSLCLPSSPQLLQTLQPPHHKHSKCCNHFTAIPQHFNRLTTTATNSATTVSTPDAYHCPLRILGNHRRYLPWRRLVFGTY